MLGFSPLSKESYNQDSSERRAIQQRRLALRVVITESEDVQLGSIMEPTGNYLNILH